MRSGSLEWWFLRMMAAASFSACSQSSSRVAIGIPLTGKVLRRLKRPTLWKEEHVFLAFKVKHRRMQSISTRSTVGRERLAPVSPRKISCCLSLGLLHTHTHTCNQPGQFTAIRKYRCFFSKITVTPEILSTTVVSAYLTPQIIAYGYQRIIKLFFSTYINQLPSTPDLWN